MSTSDIDFQEVAEWFSLLYRNARGHLHIACSGNWTGRFFNLRNGFIPAATYVEHLGRTSTTGIYARVTTVGNVPTDPGRRGGASITASVPALWADIDLAGPGHRHTPCRGGPQCTHSPAHVTPVLPLPPDAAVATSLIGDAGLPCPTGWIHSGGGLYPLWMIHPVHHISTDLAEVQRISTAWQRIINAAAKRAGFHYGAGVGDLARVLRVPGTWNRKTAQPRLCQPMDHLPSTWSDHRYTLTTLAAALANAERQLPPPPEPPTMPPLPTSRAAGDVRPGDDFAARVDWADGRFLLGKLGWEVILRRGGYREWLRPNAGPASTLSATTGRGGDNLFVFSTETPFPTGVPISKLEAYRIIHGHATHKDAVRALNEVGFGTPPAAAGRRPVALEPLQWPVGSTRMRP